MFRKSVVTWLVFVMMLALPVSTIFAQGGELPQVFCGNLSDADCQILVDSQLVMAGVESIAFGAAMEFSFDSSDETIDGFAMAMNVDGAVATNPEMLAQFQTTDPEALAEMMSGGMDILIEMLREIVAEAAITVELPAELAAEVEMPDSIALDTRMVNGVLYVDISALLPADPEAQMPGWMGLDIAGMYEMMFAMAQEEAGQDMMDMQAILGSNAFANLYDYTKWGDFMTITRESDADIMGQTAAVFHTVLDYGALFSSPEFQQAFDDYMQAVVEVQGASEDELPENFTEVMAGVMSNMQVETTQWIGLDDAYMHRMEIDYTFGLSQEAIAAIDTEAAADMPERFDMAMNLVVDLSGFNEPVVVAEPEGAQVINPMMFAEMEAGAAN